MIFYLRNNRVIARSKRIDNGRGNRDRSRRKSCSETERTRATGKRELQRSARGSTGPVGRAAGSRAAGVGDAEEERRELGERRRG